MKCNHKGKTEVEEYPDGSVNVVCSICGEVIEHYPAGEAAK